MKKQYLCNVFTTSMLNPKRAHEYRFEPICQDTAKNLLQDGFEQAVGHPGTAEVLSTRLGLDVKFNRMNVNLQDEECLIVTQVVLPRLPEGKVLSHAEIKDLPIQYWYIYQID
jgi:hypothetical protein